MTDMQRKEIARLRRRGMALAEIAETLDLPIGTVIIGISRNSNNSYAFYFPLRFFSLPVLSIVEALLQKVKESAGSFSLYVPYSKRMFNTGNQGGLPH